DRDRDRARWLQRRTGARRPQADGIEPRARPLAAVPLPDRDQERDRTQRKPVEPVSPGARGVVAPPDPQRLQPRRHAGLPPTTARAGWLSRRELTAPAAVRGRGGTSPCGRSDRTPV